MSVGGVGWAVVAVVAYSGSVRADVASLLSGSSRVEGGGEALLSLDAHVEACARVCCLEGSVDEEKDVRSVRNVLELFSTLPNNWPSNARSAVLEDEGVWCFSGSCAASCTYRSMASSESSCMRRC